MVREASGLAQWWARYHGRADDGEYRAKAAQLAAYIAADADPTELDLAEDDREDLDDGEVFVEVKTARFLAALDLPPIEELPR